MSAISVFVLVLLAVSAVHGSWNPWNRKTYSSYKPSVSNHFSHGTRFAEKPREPKRDLPVYDYVLSYINDGPCSLDLVANRSSLLEHFARAGVERDEVVRRAKASARWFRFKYGSEVDFTDLSDEEYISTEVFSRDRSVSFTAYTLPESCRYRFVMAAKKTEAEFVNVPVEDAGWMVKFRGQRGFESTGDYRGHIETPALSLYGYYFLHVCPDSNAYCNTILEGEVSPVTIRYETRYYIKKNSEPISNNFIDCNLFHETWGEGHARGIILARDMHSNITDGSNILRFPSYIGNEQAAPSTRRYYQGHKW
jgi:hypothetical protein